MSKELVKCLLSHEFYTEWGKYVHPEMFTRELQPIVNTIEKAHEKYKCDLTIDEVRDLHLSTNPTMSDSSKTTLQAILLSVQEATNYNPDVAKDVITTAFKSNICRQIIQLTVDLESGVSTDWDRLTELQHQATQINLSPIDSVNVEDTSVTLDTIVDIVEETDEQGEFQFNIPEIQKATSGIHKGALYIVSARPDGGKTAFMVSLTCSPSGLLFQGANVHIWRNEERYQSISRRCLSAILQVPTTNLSEKLDDFRNNIKDTISGSLSILKDTVTSQKNITDVEKYILDNPSIDVLIIDQIDNLRINGVSVRNDVKLIEEVYATIREYAIKYNITIFAVTQAGAEADNKLYWGYSELYGSKTGKAAAADVILCIGHQRPPAGNLDTGERVINYSKNKFGGPKASTFVELTHSTSTFTGIEEL